MITPFQIYLIAQANSIWIASYIIAALLFIGSVGFAIDKENKVELARRKNINAFGGVEQPVEENTIKIGDRGVRIIALIVLILLSIGFLMPSSKTLTMMYIIPKVANNESLQKLPDSILKYINNYITEEKKQ